MSAAGSAGAGAGAPPAATGERAPAGDRASGAAGTLAHWWPLAALTLLAAALRLSTLDVQSFWYDEAFTPVHVLHPSLGAMLESVSHTENSPPLWYVLEWLGYRLFGDGEVSLRALSALAGIATVPVAWGIGRELSSRGVAIACAGLVAVNPLFVWYSQEARVYSLFVLTSSLAMLCFLRALRDPSPRRMAAFALAGALALLTHYFAVFLLVPMAAWLLAERATRRAAVPALGAIGLVGLALLPLISAQGGHGTQWIGRWALSSRLQTIPQYYLTGYSGSSLGHGLELLVALPTLAAVGLGLWRLSSSRRLSLRGAKIALALAAGGVLLPVVLAVLGADYLAPRNLVAAMVPVTALIAVLACTEGSGLLGAALLATTAAAFLALSVDVELSPRLQRGNWRGVVRALGPAAGPRVITTVELGAAPLEYYLPGLHNLAPGSSVTASEIVETGYAPLRAGAGRPPTRGFRLLSRVNIDGLIVYRFVAPTPRPVSDTALRRHVITLAHPEVLVPSGLQGAR